ncbi:GAP family protein [Aquidulcibacter sp.]|jgi:cytochrome c biogenesis protein CcdA|uniref:GAP family protein n=1 Tax=Aquidulcibacter sp. TaxID=2052990 RepID=UPI0037847C35
MTFFTAFLAIFGLAFLDSLNPFSIAACVVVIAGQQSLARGLIFITATFSAYFLGGVALVSGWVEAAAAMRPWIKPWMMITFWLALALGSFVGAVILWRRPAATESKEAKPPTTAALVGVFLFALSSTLSDLPTALPYFGAIPIMVATETNFLGLLAWLAFYSLIYVSPLIVLLYFRQMAHKQFEPLVGSINRSMDWAIRRLTPTLLVPLAGWAVYEAVRLLLSV